MTKTQRVNKVVDWLIFQKKAETQKELAEKLKYTESSMSQILNEKVPLSERFIKKLAKLDQNINLEWLLTGEGEMLKGNTSQEDDIAYVPLLPISAQGGSLNDFVVSVKDSDCEKIISPVKGADWAITVSGDSMAPEYPSGSQILIKRINESAFIDWGKVYVLDTCNGTIIKILVPSDKEGFVRCMSINPDARYAPFDIFLGDVYGIYRVMLCMSVK